MTRYDEFLDLQSQETDDCILWPYCKARSGYGQIRANGRTQHTHRLSCEMAHGEPPTPEHTDAAHSCRNRHCLNPRHLRWATRAENMADAIRDGTTTSGEKSSTAKLTEQDVLAIRYYAKQGTKRGVMAQQYGVSHRAISMIVSRDNWRHI